MIACNPSADEPKAEAEQRVFALPADVEALRDIVYAEPMGSQQALRLDLYRPRERDERALPVLVFVHGGGWFSGNKDDALGMDAHLFTRNGYAVASVAYRLSDVAAFPGPVHDVKAAVRWLRANAEQYSLDPDHIGVWGPSAGGHLAAVLGTTAGVSELEGSHGGEKLARHSSRVQAVVNYYGVSDLEIWAREATTSVRQLDAVMMVERFLGGSLDEKLREARLASPIDHIDETDAPFLHVHGELDGVVPLAQSRRLHEKLEKHGIESTLHVVRGGKHGFRGDFRDTKRLRTMMLSFLDRHLKPSEAGAARP